MKALTLTPSEVKTGDKVLSFDDRTRHYPSVVISTRECGLLEGAYYLTLVKGGDYAAFETVTVERPETEEEIKAAWTALFDHYRAQADGFFGEVDWAWTDEGTEVVSAMFRLEGRGELDRYEGMEPYLLELFPKVCAADDADREAMYEAMGEDFEDYRM